MNYIEKQINKFDDFQKRHPLFGFPYAVIKKYGEDQAAYQGAIITYYGFLSLFPLLIILTSVLQLIVRGNDGLRDKILGGLNNYFPIVGSELQNNIHGLHKTGLSLAVGLIITLYGARGVADALRHTVNHVWQIPRARRPGFPNNVFNSLSIIIVGGVGFVVATVLSSYASGLGHNLFVRLLSSLVSLGILIVVLYVILKLSISSKKVPAKAIFASALIAAIGLQILQSIGGYVITHELKNLSLLYGVFAVVLGLLFWIYLQAQIVLYALEIGSVYHMKLWPRSIDSKKPTAQDKQAYSIYAAREQL